MEFCERVNDLEHPADRVARAGSILKWADSNLMACAREVSAARHLNRALGDSRAIGPHLDTRVAS